MQDFNNESKALNSIWSKWESSKEYMDDKGFTGCVKQWVDFYEGRQWNENDFTAELPLITINFIKMIIKNKQANINASRLICNYISDMGYAETQKVSKFMSYLDKQIDQERLNSSSIKEALVKGTGIVHYYYGEDAIGKNGLYKGALRGEVIDINDIGVSNPRERDVQNMKWIIFRRRMEVRQARDLAETDNPDVDIDRIVSDEPENDVDEQDSEKLVTVLTRYFRINGEVYHESAVKGTILYKPKALNPNIHLELLKKKENTRQQYSPEDDDEEEYEIDTSISTIQDPNTRKYNANKESIEDSERLTLEEQLLQRNKFYLYPVEFVVLDERENCIFGLSDVEALIKTQIAVNRYYTSCCKCAEDLGFPKWVVRPDALQGQEITNEPSQKIINHSKYPDGIKILQGAPFNNGQLQLPNELIGYSRSVTHSSEATTGELSGSSDSGYMVQQLIAQANKPTAQQQKMFMRCFERMGQIKLMFARFYYDDEDFTYELTDLEYDNATNQDSNAQRKVSTTFNGEDYLTSTFEIKVEAGTELEYSEATIVDFIQKYLLTGAFDNLSVDTMEFIIKTLPPAILGDRYGAFMEMIKTKREGQIATLQNQITQLTSEKEQLMAINKQYQEALKYADNVNEELRKEYSDKLDIYKAVIQSKAVEAKTSPKQEVSTPSNPTTQK